MTTTILILQVSILHAVTLVSASFLGSSNLLAAPPNKWVVPEDSLISGEALTDDQALAAFIESRENPDSVTELNFDNCSLRDVSPVASLICLQVLNLENTQVASLAPLTGLRDLKELTLGRTLVSDLRPLAGLTGLVELNLNDIPVSNLSPLKDLTNLAKLSLVDNPVSDISPLSGLTSLRELDLQLPLVSDISALARLDALMTLNLSKTRVSDLSPLSWLTRLQHLSIAETPVTSIEALGMLTRSETLKLLNLRATQIAEFPVWAAKWKARYAHIAFRSVVVRVTHLLLDEDTGIHWLRFKLENLESIKYRLRFTLDGEELEDLQSLGDYGAKNGKSITIQVSRFAW